MFKTNRREFLKALGVAGVTPSLASEKWYRGTLEWSKHHSFPYDMVLVDENGEGVVSYMKESVGKKVIHYGFELNKKDELPVEYKIDDKHVIHIRKVNG